MSGFVQEVRQRNSVRQFVNDHPMVTFVPLAYVLSWMTIPFLGDPIGTGPFFAAVIVLSLTKGWPGVKSLGRQMIQWRVNWRWYALAILLPVVTAVSASVIAVALGADTAGQLATWTEIPATFLIVLLIPLTGPWEEPGFRGFALTRLTETRSVLMAALTIGGIHVFWHTPLFLNGSIPASDVVWIVAASIVFAFMVIRSGGSVLLAMLMHATNNAVSDYVSTIFSGGDAVLQGWVRASMWSVIAIVVVVVAGRSFATRPQRELSPVEPVLGAA